MLRQTLLVMKITTLILLIWIMTVSAATNAQQITLKTKNATLEEVFDKIHQQTGYDVFYSNDQLAKAKTVTVDLKNMPLAKALDMILDGQPLTYKIDDQTVVIKEKETGLLDNLKDKIKAFITNIDVHGRVVDESGLPLPGATVMIKGTSNSTIADSKGEFYLHNAESDAIIVISFVGFEKKELKAEKEMGTIKMNPASNPLDAVQVIAYGQTTNRLSIGNVTTVGARTIANQPVDNPLLALEGQVPGLQIQQQTGLPGGAVKLLIEGQNSLRFGNDPLYVIDGVPYISEMLPNLGGLVLGISGVGAGGQPGNPMNFINPSDIESISVLKDAAATAIYGSRAASGAILITTKKGKAGATKVTADLQDGWGRIDHTLDMMNTQQYLAMRYQALRDDGIPGPSPFDYDLNGTWDPTRSTNWEKTLMGGTVGYQNYNTTVSGGSSNTQYLVGATYHRQTSVFPDNNLSDQKADVHFNLSSASSDGKFHLSFSGSYLFDNNLLPQFDPTSYILELAPDAPPLHNNDGTLNWAPNISGASTWQNPLSLFLSTYAARTYNLTSSGLLSYNILPGFDMKTSFGYNNMQVNEVATTPLSYQPPEIRPYVSRRAQYANNNVNSWIIEPQLTYHKLWKKHTFDLLVGATFQHNNENGYQVQGTGYNSDAVLADIHSAATLVPLSSVISEYKYNASFGRLSYNWNQELLFDLTARRDGSSRFGPENEFHNFGAIGAGWIFTQEQWIKNNLPFLTYGKLSGSYGTTGKDQIPDYQYLSLYSPYTAGIGVPYEGIGVIKPNALANPYIQWETTKKLDASVELGFLNDRILANATWFRNRSSNQLLGYNLPIITGFQDILENFPATIQNSGWEFSLKTVNINSGNFSWKTNFNLTLPQNKLISFPGLATSSYANEYVIGQPVNVAKSYHFLGVDPATGAYVVADHNGNPTTTPNTTTDYTSLVNINPTAYGGIENIIRYRQFELDFTFQFSRQNAMNDYFGLLLPGYFGINQPTNQLAAWSKPGDVSPLQRYNSTGSIYGELGNVQYSDAGYEQASYMRLKNLALSWQLPSNWTKSVGINAARLICRGQNLLTFTPYTGPDPETAGLVIPPLRIITLGLNVTL